MTLPAAVLALDDPRAIAILALENPMDIMDHPIVQARRKLYRRLRDTEARLWLALAKEINWASIRYRGMSADRADKFLSRTNEAVTASKNRRAAEGLLNDMGIWP